MLGGRRVLQKVSDEGAEVGDVGDGVQRCKDVEVGDEPEIVEELLTKSAKTRLWQVKSY